MDGFAFDIFPSDAIAPGLADQIAGLAAPPLLALAIAILIVVAIVDLAGPSRGHRR